MRIALALALTLLLGACGKSTPPAPEPDGAAAPAPTLAPAPTPDAAPAPTPDAAPDAAPEPDGASDAAPTADAAPAPDAAPPEPPRPATTPEEALRFYFEGTRDKDAAKLWMVMSTSARAALEGVKTSAAKSSDDELAKVGLTRAALEAMTVEAFFAHMVSATPMPVDAFAKDTPTDVKVEGEGPKRTVRFKLGAAFCEAQVLEEDGHWKVDGSQCEEGG